MTLATATDIQRDTLELAERLRGEAPTGSQVVAQGSWPGTYAKVYGPFAFLGGLVN